MTLPQARSAPPTSFLSFISFRHHPGRRTAIRLSSPEPPYDGIYDIYAYSLSDATLRRLTNDIYLDASRSLRLMEASSFHPTAAALAMKAIMNLFRLASARQHNLATNLSVASMIGHPSMSEQDLLFSSDRSGASNIYLTDINGHVFRLTDFATGAFDPVESAMTNWSLVPMRISGSASSSQPFDSSTFRLDHCHTRRPSPPGIRSICRANWKRALSITRMNSPLTLPSRRLPMTPFTARWAASRPSFPICSATSSTTCSSPIRPPPRMNLLKSFSVGVTYINKTRRLNYGIGAFHLYDEHL